VTAHQATQVARSHDEGEALWLLGGLYTFRALNDETGLYTLVEVRGPEGLAIPLHFHEREEEGFYIAQGEVTIFLDDASRTLSAGGFAMAPRGVGHAFRLDTPDAALVLLISPGPAHEAMFREMGEPAATRSIPEPLTGPPDDANLARIAAKHGTQITGPPPARR
jgi:quercetin dioxygenase-like cupin family protein